jgi:hypothetical protein
LVYNRIKPRHQCRNFRSLNQYLPFSEGVLLEENLDTIESKIDRILIHTIRHAHMVLPGRAKSATRRDRNFCLLQQVDRKGT